MTIITADVATDNAGRLIVTFDTEQPGTLGDFAIDWVVRYLADGTLDTSFGAAGFVEVPTVTGSQTGNILMAPTVVDSAGRLVLGVSTGFDYRVLRLTDDGEMDASFGPGGFSAQTFNGIGGMAVSGDGLYVVDFVSPAAASAASTAAT